MQNNLYYTPTIEEFHVGFEYQELWGLKNINEEWLTQLYDENDLIQNLCETLRVKYLDQSDIESLGWKLIKSNDNRDTFILEINNEFKYGLYKNSNSNNINIDSVDNKKYITESKSYFKGTIKNKSELKKLMQQLNIK